MGWGKLWPHRRGGPARRMWYSPWACRGSVSSHMLNRVAVQSDFPTKEAYHQFQPLAGEATVTHIVSICLPGTIRNSFRTGPTAPLMASSLNLHNLHA